MAMHIWKQEAKCDSCEGTGIYMGYAEHDGAGVVCANCKGKGKITMKVEWEKFEGKSYRSGVERVYKINPGICIGKGRGKYKLEDFGGMPYKDWIDGKPFPKKSEMRRYTCPAWWYQTADYKEKPDWDECCHFGSFSDCRNFSHKEQCWERFDKEQEASK